MRDYFSVLWCRKSPLEADAMVGGYEGVTKLENETFDHPSSKTMDAEDNKGHNSSRDVTCGDVMMEF